MRATLRNLKLAVSVTGALFCRRQSKTASGEIEQENTPRQVYFESLNKPSNSVHVGIVADFVQFIYVYLEDKVL